MSLVQPEFTLWTDPAWALDYRTSQGLVRRKLRGLGRGWRLRRFWRRNLGWRRRQRKLVTLPTAAPGSCRAGLYGRPASVSG